MPRARRAVFAVAAALVFVSCALGQTAPATSGAALRDAAASYPEGPLWDGGRLLVAEMGADQVSAHGPAGKAPVFAQRGCGPTAVAGYGAGFVVLCHLSAELVAIDRAGRPLTRWRADAAGRALQNPNDAAADGAGAVYVSDPGVFSRRAPATGAVLRLGPDGRLRRVAEGLWYPNGVWVDRTGRALYVSEHLARRVWRYPILPDGGLGPRRLFAAIDLAAPADRRFAPAYPEAGPDGLEIAPNGELFVAIYGEGRILRFGPDGRFRGALEVGPRYVTNIAFQPDGTAAVTAPILHDRPPFTGQVLQFARLAPPPRARALPSRPE